MKHPNTPETTRVVHLADYNGENGRPFFRAYRTLLPQDPKPTLPRLTVVCDIAGGEKWAALSRSQTAEISESGEPTETFALRIAEANTISANEFNRIRHAINTKCDCRLDEALKNIRHNLAAATPDPLIVLEWLQRLADSNETADAGIVDFSGFPTRQTLANRHPTSEYFVAWNNGHSTGEESFQNACGVACSGCEPDGTTEARVYDGAPNNDVGVPEPHEYVLRAEVFIPTDDND